MNYMIFAAVAAFLAAPQVAYEQNGTAFGPNLMIPAVELESKAETVVRKLPEVLERIAICESQGKHFDADGNVLRGNYNKYDIGKFQINVLYWQDLADELGHDVYTEEGNEAVALAIYEKYGTAPWKWSKKCWNK